MDRETGVMSKPCPNCGTELTAVQQADGSVAYDTCQSCYPETEKAASTAAPSQQIPTNTPPPMPQRTVGSDITPGDDQ